MKNIIVDHKDSWALIHKNLDKFYESIQKHFKKVPIYLIRYTNF